jgi:hypothetical protein
MTQLQLKTLQAALADEDAIYERACEQARKAGATNPPPRTPRPAKSSAAWPLIQELFAVDEHDAVVQMLSGRLLTVEVNEATPAFCAWVRSRFTQPSEQFGLRHCLTGPGWFAEPKPAVKALPSVLRSRPMNYRFRHLYLMGDYAEAAAVLRESGCSIPVGRFLEVERLIRGQAHASRGHRDAIDLIETEGTIGYAPTGYSPPAPPPPAPVEAPRGVVNHPSPY